MLLLLLRSVCVLSAPVCISAVATETVVGVAGQAVALPCRLESVKQSDVEVCWGRGEPSLFTCHNTLINAAGDHVTYQRSHRFSLSSSSSSLSIFPSRLSDSGFYHCRVQVPGLFNDETSTVHLLILRPRPETSEPSEEKNEKRPNEPRTTTSGVTEKRGSDVTAGDSREPMVALVQSPVLQDPTDTLQMFIGNTLRLAFIIFIPALLLTAAYGVCRSKRRSDTDGRPDQSEEEDDDEEEEEGSSAV